MWARLMEGGSQIASKSYSSVSPGETGVAALSFTMPSRDVFFDSEVGTVGTVTDSYSHVVRLLVVVGSSLTLSLSPSQVSPGQTVNYSGKLTRNDTGSGVSSQTISVNTPSGGQTKSTDSNGNYSGSFSAPGAGSYNIVASFAGTTGLSASSAEQAMIIGEIGSLGLIAFLGVLAYLMVRK